jgi:hypothetical protein
MGAWVGASKFAITAPRMVQGSPKPGVDLDMCHGLGGPQPRGFAAGQRSAMCILTRSSGVYCGVAQCSARFGGHGRSQGGRRQRASSRSVNSKRDGMVF